MSTKQLHLDRTETSPQVDIDMEQGLVEFVGRSLPHNSEKFYQRIYSWLDQYLTEEREETTVNVKLDYLDTSSSKHFFNIFQRLDAVSERGQKVNVNWHFENGDEDMEETGKDYQSFFDLPFHFIEVEELF